MRIITLRVEQNLIKRQKWCHKQWWLNCPWIPLTKTIDAEVWCFLWSALELNSWTNNGGTCDLRRHRTHYDVTVICMAYWIVFECLTQFTCYLLLEKNDFCNFLCFSHLMHVAMVVKYVLPIYSTRVTSMVDWLHWTLADALVWNLNRNTSIFKEKIHLKLSAKWCTPCVHDSVRPITPVGNTCIVNWTLGTNFSES